MRAFLVWIEDNWFTLLQGVGIVGGLLFTAVSIRRDTKARRVSDLLTLTEHHRDLWSEVHRRPDLSRVLDSEADLVAKPITAAEEKFLFVAIVHFHTGWQLAREASLLTLDVLAADAHWFFNLPIPRAVWEQAKGDRDPLFVRFVEQSRRGQ